MLKFVQKSVEEGNQKEEPRFTINEVEQQNDFSEHHLRWLITVSSTFQDVDFDGSLLPLFITKCYNHGIKKLPKSPVNTLVSTFDKHDETQLLAKF